MYVFMVLVSLDIFFQIDKSLDIFDYDKAVKWTEKGLEVHPGNVILLDKAGPVFLEAGLVDKAHNISYPSYPMQCFNV